MRASSRTGPIEVDYPRFRELYGSKKTRLRWSAERALADAQRNVSLERKRLEETLLGQVTDLAPHLAADEQFRNSTGTDSRALATVGFLRENYGFSFARTTGLVPELARYSWKNHRPTASTLFKTAR